jgi:TrmH family RNA methyltransferase
MQQNCFKIVLVEPQDSLNIGAVARAMTNFGFSDLILVRPVHYQKDIALRTGCHAEAVLEKLQVFSSLEEACHNCEQVVGFTARSSKNRLSNIDLADFLPLISSLPAHRVCLVFGPESTGLRVEHLQQCHQLVSIPTAEENRSLNLAQAVLVVLYELFLKLRSPNQPTYTNTDKVQLAPFQSYTQLELLVTQAAESSGFLGVASPGTMPGILKALIKKNLYTKREMQILLGLFDRVVKSIK